MKHFKQSEFASPDIEGSGARMRLGTVEKLDAARVLWGKHIDISSAYRSTAWNTRVGGKKNSAHLGGYAVDIRGISDDEMLALLDILWTVGFTRIGIMATAIHVDDDPNKAKVAMWNYSTTPALRWKLAQNWFTRKKAEL